MAKKHKFFLTKLAVFTVMMIGCTLMFSGGKAAAADSPGQGWSCPSAANDVPGKWGMQYGGLEHTFASVAVYAHEDGKSYADGKLNVSYHMKSSVDKNHSYGPAPKGVPASLYPDARIFKYASGVDDVQVNGRTAERWFNTGETLTSGAGHCEGWSEIGPGTATNVGNGFILDCQEKDTGGTLRSNHFWIDSISTPTGEAGRWGGHWTVQVSSGGRTPHGVPYPMGYSSDPDPATSNNLLVENGDNARIDLTWHPNPPPITCVTNPGMPQCHTQKEADCTNAFIENTSTAGGNSKRIHVEISGITVNQNGTHGPDYDVHGNIENPDSNPGGTYANIDQFVPSSGGEQEDDVKTGKKWWYQPSTNKIHIKITTEGLWDKTGDGVNNPTWNYINTVRDADVQCFAAHCDMAAYGDGPGGLILAGGTIHFRGTYYNDSPPPDYLTLWWPSVKDQGGGLHGVNVEQVLGGGNYPLSFDVGNAGGGNIADQNWDFTPVYFNGEGIGPACHANVKTYKRFNVKPGAEVQLSPTAENPNNVKFIGRAEGEGPNGVPSEGLQVDYSATSTSDPYGTLDSKNERGTVPSVYTYNYTPPANKAGDKYCLDFYVAQTSGYVGPGNDLQYTNADYPPMRDCKYVYDRPYVRAYGADVIAGSNFKTGSSCDTTSSARQIRAFRSLASGKGGSGAQFAALALAEISGFSSSSVKMSGPSDGTGLTFANTVNTSGGDTDRPNDGGLYAGDPVCAEDYYSKQTSTKPLGSSTSPADLTSKITSLNGGKPTQFLASGDLVIDGGTFNKQAVIYVNGDVLIKGNLQYGSSGQYLAIVAKGNIYINKDVTRLDGVYIAQPKESDGSKGVIYTCTPGTNSTTLDDLYGVSELYGNCRGAALVVNGAFVAKSVQFLRAINSLRNSQLNEKPSNFSDGTGTKAAEVFNFSPEIYLYTPVFEDLSTDQPYDYITTLPPVL